MSKWLKFIPYPPTRFTKHYSYRVAVKQTDITYGWIKFGVGPFQQFAFWPEPNTVFDKIRLQDIADFVADLEEKRKNLIKAKKGIEE